MAAPLRYSESEQVLQTSQTTGKEFHILAPAQVSLEGIAVALASTAALTSAIALGDFEGARLLTFDIADADAGTIEVAGNDIDGNAQTETLTVTMAAETITTANAYVSSGLSATPATFTQGTADVTGTVSGNWVVQSSRRSANPRVWLNDFKPSDALSLDIPIIEIKGSPTRIYQITGGNPGVEGWVDDSFDVVWK